MKSIIEWITAHNFRYKILGDIILWQTNYQTAEYNIITNKTIWHQREYFNIH